MRRIYFILIISFFSCQTKEEINNIDFFPDELIGHFDENQILEIHAKFSECGEWGGHYENILITAKKDKEFYLSYEKYRVDCDSMILINDGQGEYYGPFEEKVIEYTVKVEQFHKNAIYEYSKSLLTSKFQEEYPGHAGDVFSLKKLTDSSFNINVYDSKEENRTNFQRLIEELELPTTMANTP